MKQPYDLVILGLSLSSSWGNGHATTYRALIRSLHRHGRRVLFLERDKPWYSSNRDLQNPEYCDLAFYNSPEELSTNWRNEIESAEAVIVGSYVPEGVVVARLVLEMAPGKVAFYDIDTPVTLSKLDQDDFEYLTPDLIPSFSAYLSFSGGLALEILKEKYEARRAEPLYCSVDIRHYYPEDLGAKWDLGYLGTYSKDRQPPLDSRLIQAAARWKGGRFVVAGPQFPAEITWPANVQRIEHLAPGLHRAFYNEQRFTLNITRNSMVRLGHSPSVRLFEAAACGTPIISDYWRGLEDFFVPGKEILISESPDQTNAYLIEMSEEQRREVAGRALKKVLSAHTSDHRARELETLLLTPNEATA